MITTAHLKWTFSGLALMGFLACSGGGGNTPMPTPAPVITSFTAAQGNITQGGSTTLTGVFTNGTGSINNGVGAVQSGVAISTGTLQATTTFTLSVTGAGGTTSSSTTVTVKTIADHLDYTNPTSGAYMLVKDAASTPTHLILNLMGPDGTPRSGVGFFLSADTTKVAWAKVSGSDPEYVKNGVFNLGSGVQLLKSKVEAMPGNATQLQAGVFQKGSTPVVTTGILASVALDLKSNVSLGTVTFSAVSNKAVLTNGSAAPTPIVISTGTLSAN